MRLAGRLRPRLAPLPVCIDMDLSGGRDHSRWCRAATTTQMAEISISARLFISVRPIADEPTSMFGTHANWNPAGPFKSERLHQMLGPPMLRIRYTSVPRLLAGQTTRTMASSDKGTVDRQAAAQPLVQISALIPYRLRLPYPVRQLAVLQTLLRRDIAQRRLSLRMAAKTGPISIGSLSALLDRERIADPDKQPKRPARRSTLLHVRSLTWTSPRTRAVIDRLLATDRTRRR